MEEMEHLRAYNLRLLSNILPLHVAEFFLKNNLNNDMEVSALDSVLVSLAPHKDETFKLL